MGTLVAVKYPTWLFLKLFDHTYVMCSTGAVRWSCWGGKTGGQQFKRGTASTLRAGMIADWDEKAGIRCYLINGVCHQAANRILLETGQTVKGARGYWVSSSLYGVYGRETVIPGVCQSPFHKHPGVTGDLPLCVSTRIPDEPQAAALSDDQDDARYRAFLHETLALYQSRENMDTEASALTAGQFQIELFRQLIRYRLDPGLLGEIPEQELMELRSWVEEERLPLDQGINEGTMDVDSFVSSYNELTERFQEEALQILGPEGYMALFDLEPGDTVVLGDPEIAYEAYPNAPRGDLLT